MSLNNDLKCLILSYFIEYDKIKELATNQHLLALLQQCTVDIDGVESSVEDINLLTTLSSLQYIADEIDINSITDMLSLINLPKVKSIIFGLGKLKPLDFDNYVSLALRQYFSGIYFTNTITSTGTIVKTAQRHSRNINGKLLAFYSANQHIVFNDGILQTNCVSIKATFDTLVRYHNFFGFEVNNNRPDIANLINIPEFYKIQMPDPNYVTDVNFNILYDYLINLINKTSVTTIDQNYDTPLELVESVLVNANTNKLENINIPIDINLARAIIAKSPKLKTLTILVKDDHDQQATLELSSKYPQIHFKIEKRF